VSKDDPRRVYRIQRHAPDALRLYRNDVLVDEDHEREHDNPRDIERWGSSVAWAEDHTIIAWWEPQEAGDRWQALMGVAYRHVRWQFEDVTAWDELGPAGDSNRHIEAARDGRYLAAAALSEVLAARDQGGVEAVAAYERVYGVVPEAAIPPEAEPDLTPISGREFVDRWTVARRELHAHSNSGG
jgi:hypothetical protein